MIIIMMMMMMMMMMSQDLSEGHLAALDYAKGKGDAGGYFVFNLGEDRREERRVTWCRIQRAGRRKNIHRLQPR
jgi:hypothetical protein